MEEADKMNDKRKKWPKYAIKMNKNEKANDKRKNWPKYAIKMNNKKNNNKYLQGIGEYDQKKDIVFPSFRIKDNHERERI